MRTLSFDSFEFDNPCSEEGLELWIAARGKFPFPDVRSFVATAATPDASKALGHATPLVRHAYYGLAREYLARFAGLIVPTPCNWLAYELFNDTCDWDAVFETPDRFIRFHWWSTA